MMLCTKPINTAGQAMSIGRYAYRAFGGQSSALQGEWFLATVAAG
jgi:hypothetical protein